MQPFQQRFKPLILLLALMIPLTSAPAARATEAWENGRAYTKMLEEHAAAAAKVAAIAAAAAAFAANEVIRHKAAVVRAATAVQTAAAIAALAQAEAALVLATTIAAGAKTAAVTAAAAVAAFALGTYIGQGLRGVWDWCWDPLCDATFSAVPIYPYIPPEQVMYSTDLIEPMLPTATFLATSGELSFSQSDFDAAGIPTDFPVIGMQLFIGASRGAASATAENWADVLVAADELQPVLVQYRAAVEAAADVIDYTAYVDPTADMAAAIASFEAARNDALYACDSMVDDCVTMAAELQDASDGLASVQTVLATVDWATLVNSPLFKPITLSEFQQFLLDTATYGAAALPQAEIDVADYLLEQAGVFYPGQPSQGPMIAAYDAQGDPNGNESLLFDPVTGELTLPELLRDSATLLSQNGAWLNIDLSQSELVQEAQLALSTPVPIFSFPARMALLLLLIAATWAGIIYRRQPSA